jgi:hypothetical protein
LKVGVLIGGRNPDVEELRAKNFFAPFLLHLRNSRSKSLKIGVILSASVDTVDAKFCNFNLRSLSFESPFVSC